MNGDELLDEHGTAALRDQLRQRATEIDVPADLRAGVEHRHRRIRRRRTVARSGTAAVVVAAVVGVAWWTASDGEPSSTDVATSDATAAPDPSIPGDRVPSSAECETLVGPEPWITLFQAEPTSPCVVVAEFQDLQIWNKGFDSITVGWVDGPHDLDPDESFATGPIGNALDPGDHTFDAEPYAMPTIRLLAPEASPTAGHELIGETFGPVAPGTTVEEAEAAMGVSIVPSDLLTGGCAQTVRGDPYSPTFLVTDPEGSRVITGVVDRDEPVSSYTCGRPEDSGRVATPPTVPADVEAMFSSLMIDSIDAAPDLPLADDAVLLIGDQHRQPLGDASEPSDWIADVEYFNGASGPIDVLDALDGLRGPTTVVAEGPVARCGIGDPLPAPDLGVEVTAWALYPIDVDSCLQWFSIELFVTGDGRVAAVRYDHWEP